MTTLADATACLNADRVGYLSRLLHRMTISARATYVADDTPIQMSYHVLRCHNELLHQISAHLTAGRYNNDTFLADMLHHAAAHAAPYDRYCLERIEACMMAAARTMLDQQPPR